MIVTFAYSNGAGLIECDSKDISELREHIQQLCIPKKSLFLSPPTNINSYLDFHSLDDGSIEMEIMEGCENNFATVDVSIAAQVVEITWSDNRNVPLKQKLNGLPIKWLTQKYQ